jgi:hypothetical protein
VGNLSVKLKSAASKEKVTSLLLTLGFFIMSATWGLSSPPGSTADDDFHAVSIVCAQGSGNFCQVSELDPIGNPSYVTVPDRIAGNCFFTSFPSVDASCIADQEGFFTETARFNSVHVSEFFYTFMNRFLGSEYDPSIRAMRLFNCFVFSALLFIALITVVPRVRRGLALLLMTAMIPFAIFFIPSINPSSWTITSVIFAWVFLYSLIRSIGTSPPLSLTAIRFSGLIISLILAVGSRKDSLFYIFVGGIASLILTWPQLKKSLRWALLAMAAAGGIIAWIFLGDRANGFVSVVSSNFLSPATLIEYSVELPSVIAGIIGSSAPIFRSIPNFYYGIGWHEVQMPAVIIFITLSTLAGLVFSMLPHVRKRALIAVAFVIFMMVSFQLYPLVANEIDAGAAASPRYMTPLFLLAVVIFLSTVKLPRSFPSRAQALWIFIAMPLANAIALLTTIRRYTNGQDEPWFELIFEPNWWWEDFPLGPIGVWSLGVGGSLMVSYAALRILRERQTQVKVARNDFQITHDLKVVEEIPEVPEIVRDRSRVIFGASWVFSLLSAWFLLRLPGELNPAANLFRGYFPNDQLSYAGIAASAKAGNFGLVEPFTQTGISFYPSWWYKIIGQFADWTGMEIPAAWSFLGFSVILGSVALIGFAAFRITGRAWAPLVIGVLLWIGPLSSILFNNWYVSLDSHAVLWGPYGALYPLNAEAAGLAIGAAALVLGYWTISRPDWSRNKRLALFGISGLGLGVIANFQTYSFLTLTAVVFWALAVAGLLQARSRRALLITVGSLILVLIVGSFLRDVIGSLPIYVLMLMTTLPGLWLFARSRLQLFGTGLGFFIIGAAPQILWMISGTLNQDPFLTYRVDQSGSLGVPLWAFLLLGSPILITWLAILWAQILRNGVKEIALLVGWFIAFVLLSFNNSWGFGQEPYRFWIDSVIVFVFVAALTIPTALNRSIFSHRGLVGVIAIGIVLVGASIWNVGGFRTYVGNQQSIDFDEPRVDAITELVAINSTPEDLIIAEPCIDPGVLKVATGARIAFYNLGLAWPENKEALDAVLESSRAGTFDIDQMRSAGITQLITDSSCPTVWFPGNTMGVAQAGSVEYTNESGAQRVDLWKIL